MESFVLVVLTLAWASTPPKVEVFLFNTEAACQLAAGALNSADQPVTGLCLPDPIVDGDPA